VRNAGLRVFGEWLLTAVIALLIMGVFSLAFPGRWLSLPVIAVSIGAATLGKLSYSAERAVVRRVRSRRAGGS
jgi:hypothetical protein